MNPVVKQLYESERQVDRGLWIPHAWYQSPLLSFDAPKTKEDEEVKDRSGDEVRRKPHVVAITLLADIMFWYSPSIVGDEVSNQEIGFRTRFAADKLQKQYEIWGGYFGFTKRQTIEAAHFLRDKGFITIEYRNVNLPNGMRLNNVTYFEPVLEKVQSLSVAKPTTTKPQDKEVVPSHFQTGEVSHSNGGDTTFESGTCTDNTSSHTSYTNSSPMQSEGDTIPRTEVKVKSPRKKAEQLDHNNPIAVEVRRVCVLDLEYAQEWRKKQYVVVSKKLIACK